MSALHLITLDFPPSFDGGVASWALDLAWALCAAGQPVTVYAKRDGDTATWDAAQPFPIVRMWGRSWGRWQGAWAALWAGGRLEPGDRVVFATWPLASALASRAVRRGCRVGIAFHGSDLTRLPRGEAPPALQRALSAAHALLPVSEFLADRLRALGGERAAVLPAPIDVGPSELDGGGGLGGGAGGLIAVARLNRLKGIDRCVRIAAAGGWPLTVVGDGPERGALESLARELEADVTFAGRVPRGEALASQSGRLASLLLPRVDGDGTGAEGLGLVLLEAAARGVPAVGCRTGGVPEAVGPGLVLDEPDEPKGSAAAIAAWLSGGDRGAEARSWVRSHHGPARSASALLEALG